MRYEIIHDVPGRLRLRCGKWLITEDEGRGIALALCAIPQVETATVRSANGSILVSYQGAGRAEALDLIDGLDVLDLPKASEDATQDLALLDNRFQMQLATTVLWRVARRLLLPYQVRNVLTVIKSVGYLYRGIRSLGRFRLGVEVLDATAIAASVLMRNYSTASSVMFLLHISDILADHTQARTRCALRQNLAVCAESVWLMRDGIETEASIDAVRVGDSVSVRMGSMVPLDGTVVEGGAEVNEASMTGESALVRKAAGSTVYAGTVVDEGSIVVRVTAEAGQSRIDGIVDLVENSQELKAQAQSRAERLADAMVPFSLSMFVLELLVTRNVQRAMSVLMVDYSCAIKLSTPIAVMSAMREATRQRVVVKGGKYLEALAVADTIVFDKTGTLTSARPQVERIIRFNDMDEDELLRLAACLEEHFPHSMARAIVRSAHDKGLHHGDEKHAEVEYIVAHGIASSVDSHKVRIGSAHFIFEDEGVLQPSDLAKRLEEEASTASTVFLAIDGQLAGALCISDPLRPEAAAVVAGLRERGFHHIAMLTGDSRNCADAVAEQLGLDEVHAQVLPEDKASYVEEMKRRGRTVVMVGDGINDSPALAAADVSIALSDASDIARTVADVSVLDSSLEALLSVSDLSKKLMDRIENSYRFIVTFNTALIVLGLAGVLQPAMGAMLHNASTVTLAAANTRPLIKEGGNRQPAAHRLAGAAVDAVAQLPAADFTQGGVFALSLADNMKEGQHGFA